MSRPKGWSASARQPIRGPAVLLLNDVLIRDVRPTDVDAVDANAVVPYGMGHSVASAFLEAEWATFFVSRNGARVFTSNSVLPVTMYTPPENTRRRHCS